MMTILTEDWRTPATDGSTISGRVEFIAPIPRGEGGSTLATTPDTIPITDGHFSATIPGGPYRVKVRLVYITERGERLYNGEKSTEHQIVVPDSGTHRLQELIDTYNPNAYSPPVVAAAIAARDAAVAAKDAAAAILEDVQEGAVPDAAVAALVAGSGPTKAALDGAYVRFTDQNGDPLPPGSVTTIVINTTTGEIDDITFEEA